MMRIILSSLLLLATLSCAASSQNGSQTYQAPLKSEKTVSVFVTKTVPQQDLGWGYENRDTIKTAYALICQKKFEEAVQLLDSVITNFEKNYIKGKGRFLSFDSLESFENYDAKQENHDTLFLDRSYRDAYFYKAFIANEQGAQTTALMILEKVLSISPQDPVALCEMGNNMIALKKYREGIEKYQEAYAMSKEYDRYSQETAMALRGMGFIYIELGELANARSAYLTSLEYEPDNKIARHELEFIDSLSSR